MGLPIEMKASWLKEEMCFPIYPIQTQFQLLQGHKKKLLLARLLWTLKCWLRGNSQFGILMKSHFWSYTCTWWLWTLLPAQTQTFVVQPPLLFRKWEMHEPQWFLQVLLTSTGPSLAELIQWFLIPHPFLSTQYFSSLNQFPVHTAGDKRIDPKLVVKAVTGQNFTSGGISPKFPKLYKKINVQHELKLCWFFNFCIYKGDSNGQSKQSCNQSFFCSHSVPQVMNTFHTTSSQSLCPDRLYYLYLCNTL